MHIEHVALYVKELERTRDFFMRYFGAVPGALYHNRTTGFRSYFLSFGGGARREIMHRLDMSDPARHPARTGYAHIAFSLGSAEAVDRLTAQLQADGYAVLSGPRTTGDGYYESCIVDLEGNQIEITV